MKLRSILFISFLVLSPSCNAGSLCSPKDNNARILSAPSPNAIDPQWSGGGFIGTGWSFYVTETVTSPTGVFAKGNLHGSRGGIAQAGVYVLLSEWNCAESGAEVTEGIERVDADLQAAESAEPPPQPLPQTFSVLTEKGRRVELLVTNFGRIFPITRKFEGINSKDSINGNISSYNMTYRMEAADRLPKEGGAYIGYEFRVPRIARGDRLIVNRRSERPHEVAEGGIGYETIDAPWVYGSADSGTSRILFAGFDGPQNMENLGEWTSVLVVNG